MYPMAEDDEGWYDPYDAAGFIYRIHAAQVTA